MIAFPTKKYSIIYADPPWSYNDKGFGYRPGGAESGSFAPEAGRYPTMPLEEICALPIKDIADKNCVLFMWAVSPLLDKAFEVINEWGFKYKTVAFVWVKTTARGKEVSNLGQYTLGNTEYCLLATRGHLTRKDRTVRQLVHERRERHSAKPPIIRRHIEQIYGSEVPRIELFCRGAIAGWDVWGNEASEEIIETHREGTLDEFF